MEVDMLKRFTRMIRQFGLYMSANLRNAMQLKAAFWLDVVGMMINNSAFVIIWIFFFMKMGTVNGWGTIEAIGLNGMVGLMYGITHAFAGGAKTLPQQINTGNFDNYILSPVNLYLRIITSYSQASAFGDILYGSILVIVFVVLAQLPFLNILLLLLLIPVCALLMINFLLVSGLIAFLIPDTAEVATNLFELMVNPSLYPSGLYSSGMKFFFLFVIPAIAIAGAPIELIRSPNVGMLLSLVGLSSAWMVLTLFLLKQAVRKYESGNLIGFKG